MPTDAVGCLLNLIAMIGWHYWAISRHIDQLDVKDKSCASRNLSRHPVGSVAHVRRDGELGPLAFRHLGHTLVPAGNHLDDGHYDDDDDDDGDGDDDGDDEEEGDDHLLPSNVELEWLASVSRAVDLATVLIAIVMLEKQNDALGDDNDGE